MKGIIEILKLVYSEKSSCRGMQLLFFTLEQIGWYNMDIVLPQYTIKMNILQHYANA